MIQNSDLQFLAPKNYLLSPGIETGRQGWGLFNTTLTSKIPTGGITSGAASITTFAPTTTNPLSGDYSLRVASSGAITAGHGFISDAFTIDRKDRAKVIAFSFSYEPISGTMDFSGTSANTWAVYIYDVSGGAWIQPAGVYNMIQASGVGIGSGTFQTTATGTQYRIALICITATSGPVEIVFDDFNVGPQKTLQGPSGPVGEIIATGSVTPPYGFLYCNGQSVSVSQYQDLFNSIGYTYGGSGASFNVPDLRGVFLRGAGSQTIGAETYSATLGSAQNDATAKNGLSASTSGSDGTHTHGFSALSSTNRTVGTQSGGSYLAATSDASLTTNNTGSAHGHAITVSSTDTETRPANVAVAYHIRYLATYQMSQDTDTRVVAFSTKSVTSGTYTQTATGTFQNLPAGFWGTPLVNTHGTWDSGTNGGEYIIPVSGIYKIQVQAGFAVSSVGVRTGRILIDGSEITRASDVTVTASSTPAPLVYCVVQLNAGQKIRTQFYQNSGGNLDYYVLNNGTYNIFTVERLSGPATIVDTGIGGVPLGSIIAFAGGYFTGANNTGSWTDVFGNTIATVNAYVSQSGYLVCDGTAPNDPTSPVFNSASKYLPNLTDSRFLQGSTAAGTIGGQNSVTLSVANLPAHSHTIDHTHAAGGRHEHIITINDGSTPGYPLYNIGGGGGSGYFQRAGFTEAPNALGTGNTTRFTKAEQNLTSMPGVSIDSAHTHSFTGSSGNGSGTSTAIENRPAYFNAFYIMRIK